MICTIGRPGPDLSSLTYRTDVAPFAVVVPALTTIRAGATLPVTPAAHHSLP
jgi:hypothetical protein